MGDKYEEILFKHALDHGKFEYEDLAATWRDIERKAQGNIAIAGIFLAGVSLVYRSVVSPSSNLDFEFFMSVLILSTSAVCAVIVLLVEDMDCIEDTEEIRGEIEHILKTYPSNIPKDRYRQFFSTRESAWLRVNNGLHNENMKKASWLTWAQRTLIAGICSTSLVFYGSVFG